MKLYRGVQKKFMIDLEEKCLSNSKNKVFLKDGVFLFIYSHLVKKLELSKLCRKKLWGSKNSENGLLKKVSLSKKDTFLSDFCFHLN